MVTRKGLSPRMSDAAVQRKTGKTWDEWFQILDAAGGEQMDHKQMVAYLHAEHGVGDWWQQMVTVTYEQARGKRLLHERPEGFQVSVSKTVAVPVARLYRALRDGRTRARWLPQGELEFHKATPDKSLRGTWGKDRAPIDVNLYPKGEAKSQVSLQHGKLPSAGRAAEMKVYWSAALARLKEILES